MYGLGADLSGLFELQAVTAGQHLVSCRVLRRQAGTAYRRQDPVLRGRHRLAALVLAPDRDPARGFILQGARCGCVQWQRESRYCAQQERCPHRLGGHHHLFLMREKVAATQVVGRLIRTIRQGLTMKRILFTTVSLGVLGLMSPALAADLTIYSNAPAVVSASYDGCGFLFGVFGGYGLGNHNLTN